MRLRQFAETIGISYSTALRMFRRAEIPGAYKLPSGTIVVPDSAIDDLGRPGGVSNENLIAVLEFIERASCDVLGQSDAAELMQLIQRVIEEHVGGITYDCD